MNSRPQHEATKSPFSPESARGFGAALLTWFDAHKRDLPWRRSGDPYAIWVSEVMLQQTRVAAVLDHYANWMRRFPNVETLAAASEEEVLAAWSGLGYYRRARFLHNGAKAVVAGHNGEIPRTAWKLLQLPGIGAYTSAAIASIAFGEPVAVVDGNVERVLLRQAGAAEAGSRRDPQDELKRNLLSAKGIQEMAASLIDRARAGDSNQAIMELGATVCLPRNPLCLQCPVQDTCRTRGEHPIAVRKPSLREEICLGLATRKSDRHSEVLLRRRPDDATVMSGMWELPELQAPLPANERPILILRHAIMRTIYSVSIFELSRLRIGAIAEDTQRWVELSGLSGLPLTGLARKVLIRLGLLHRG